MSEIDLNKVYRTIAWNISSFACGIRSLSEEDAETTRKILEGFRGLDDPAEKFWKIYEKYRSGQELSKEDKKYLSEVSRVIYNIGRGDSEVILIGDKIERRPEEDLEEKVVTVNISPSIREDVLKYLAKDLGISYDAIESIIRKHQKLL